MGSVGSPTKAGEADPQLLKAARNEKNRTLVFARLVVIRAFNAYWLCTFFQPDEYFQSLEPAWRLAFGEGSGAWVTWEWRHQLRSSLHPALFAGAYWIAEQISHFVPFAATLRPVLLLATPRAVQTIFAAASDWYTWQFAVKIFGPDSNSSWFALFMSMCNPFQWFCSTRTFSNSLETTLTIMALYYWPWELFNDTSVVKENPKGSKPPLSTTASVASLRKSLVLAALAVVLRPTNLLIWLAILFTTVVTKLANPASPITSYTMSVLIREVILCGSFVLGLSAVSDRLYFGEWTFPPYKFLYFNITQSLAVFYGRNRGDYYLTEGLPLLSTAYLPFVARALWNPKSTGTLPADLILVALAGAVRNMVFFLTLISHKEVRFIYPLLPILHILAAPYASSFFTTPAATPSRDRPLSRPKLRRKALLQAGLALNVFLAGYLSLFHQAAPLTVLTYIREEFESIHPDQLAALPPSSSKTASSPELFALFLTPCHSTPWRSHLIYPSLDARALTCEPPLHTAPDTPERATYRDEADRFYDDPVPFLRDELWPVAGAREDMPRYIVGFEGIDPWLHEFFDRDPHGASLGVSLTRVWEGSNGLFNDDWRRAGKLVVWHTGVHGKPVRHISVRT